MNIGFWEGIIVLPILLLAIVYGLNRLPRLIRELKQASQRQTLPEPQSHAHRQLSDYKPMGWMDEGPASQERENIGNKK
jgi:Sec-independent protein translocase protein TatA